ncbi:MAG TPA: GNAT family N-acetyltransferase [Candidatus Limnocylindria bacterium]|nr:GNAT family N-acetyltransferase [Candidatus Limnocylindria bacterium]
MKTGLTDPTQSLRTARMRLDPLEVEDAGALAAAMADPSLFVVIGGEPPSVGEAAARIERYRAGPPRTGDAWHNWAIRLAATEPDPDRLIGHLQATVREHGESVEIAWLIGTPWQGRGYASEVAAGLVEWLRANAAGAVIAHIAPGHVASERVADRAGLAPTGVVEDSEVVWRLSATEPEA